MKGQKIGIIGVGMVGGAVSRYFKSAGISPYLYDKYNKIGSPAEINKADIIFICVPTPFDKKKGFDLSAVDGAFSIIKGSKIIVSKSTVWPGTTAKMQKKYPQHKIVFNPEFLSEATADDDMQRPDIQIIGYTEKSRSVAEKVISILPSAPFERIIPAEEAEMFKYFHNVHGAVKVIFANQIYDLCKKLKIDYEIVRECAAASKNIRTGMYLNVLHGSYRGYGGSCFPKDIRALIQFGDKQGVNLELLKTAEKINNQLMKKQKISDPEKLGRSRDKNRMGLL
jgi:UDPglucose 6-dehydrogenase